MNATDYETLTRLAGLIELPEWGVVEATGADRIIFLHNLLSNDIKTLSPRGSCRAALLTPSAKMIAELVVLADAERHWLLSPRACLPALLAALDRYLITEQVALSDQSLAWRLLALQGPGAPHIAACIADARSAPYEITGEGGRLIMAKDAAAVRTQAVAAGAAVVEREALHVCRLEAGFPWWGLDMDETTLLPETGMERQLASFTKGCYVGQEIVARVDTYGSLSRKLVRIVCEGTDTPSRNDAILKGGHEIGAVTSAAWSPRRLRSMALGYVKRPHYETRTPVTIVSHGRSLSAVLS